MTFLGIEKELYLDFAQIQLFGNISLDLEFEMQYE